ncbi:MAG: hypothetical protein IKQ37_06885 [Bacteroidaceae bacterium]|nr:hypothetical protein [Bacteroidaceae bacterium]
MQIEINAVPVIKDGHSLIRITSDVEIMYPTTAGHAKIVQTRGLWDTGATNTNIRMSTAIALGIPLGEEIPVTMGASVGQARRCQFYLRFPSGDVLHISDGVAVPNMKSSLIIGMDVMSHGLTIIKPDGNGGVNFMFRL